MEKAPSYARYPKQVLGDDRVLAMDWDAYGMHNWLLDLSWQQEPRGTIPNDIALIRRWLRSPSDETWRRVYPQIRTAWVACGELTDTDARTGEPIFPESVRGLGFERLANRGMLRTSLRKQNYITGNSMAKGVVRKQSRKLHAKAYANLREDPVNERELDKHPESKAFTKK